MKWLFQILVVIVVNQLCGEVKCKPIKQKHVIKKMHLGFVTVPLTYVSYADKTTPFEKYALKHSIKKRQITESEPLPIMNEVATSQILPNEEPMKIPITQSLEEAEKFTDTEKGPAEVIITSVIEPIEPGKQISFFLPVDSEVVITPAVKEVNESPPPPLIEATIVPVNPEPEPTLEVVASQSSSIVEITPRPIDIPPPPPIIRPLESNIDLTTSMESTVPLIAPVPLFERPNAPVIGPLINNFPTAPFLYTNIRRIPFYTPANIGQFINPNGFAVPEVIIPGPPPVQDLPPVPKEEPPNFFVKSSRFVLYVGSMMLQMLSQFVNGRANLNPVPLTPSFPGVQ